MSVKFGINKWVKKGKNFTWKCQVKCLKRLLPFDCNWKKYLQVVSKVHITKITFTFSKWSKYEVSYSYSCTLTHWSLNTPVSGHLCPFMCWFVCLAPPNGHGCHFGSNTGKNSDGRIWRHRPNPLEDLENGRQRKEILIYCRYNVRPEFLLKIRI